VLPWLNTMKFLWPNGLPAFKIRPHRSDRMSVRAQRAGLYGVAALMLLTLWGLILWFSVQQRQRLIDESTRELAQMNSAVAQHAAGLFKAIETDLRTLDLWLQAQPTIDPLTDAQFIALVDEMRRTSGGLIDLRAVSSDGQLYYLPSPDRRPRADVSDRPYYTGHLAPGPARLHIGDPVLSRVTGKWGIPVSWPLTSPTGGLRVLFAAVELDRLVAMHERLRLKPEGTIVLVRLDGIVLSRTPFDARFVGHNATVSPFFRSEYGSKPRGSFLSSGAVTDGVARLVSYERLEDYPVTVLVTRGLNEVLQTYHQRRRVVFLIAAALSLIVVGFTIALHRSLHALHLTQQDLLHQAETDGLTGLMNRRALFEQAQREFERARRFGRPMAVLLLDIDHFKRLNDSQGHATGDRVLSGCAELWRSTLRAQDLLGRVGGEEFCTVLPETSPEEAAQVAERLRAATAERAFTGRDGHCAVSVSIGWSSLTSDDQSWSEVLDRADRAVYVAKASGRNRVQTHVADAVV
jgi:diguanylate cyclase (GGDEF)-like protein